MQLHWNIYLGVAKQLGLERPGEERQARAGAHSALACVIPARHLRKEVRKREGREGWEKKSKAGKGRKNVAQRSPFGALLRHLPISDGFHSFGEILGSSLLSVCLVYSHAFQEILQG